MPLVIQFHDRPQISLQEHLHDYDNFIRDIVRYMVK